MLSPKSVAQPNPSFPALCRQDTTSPRSADNGRNIHSKKIDTNDSVTDYGGGIFLKTRIQMLEAAYHSRENNYRFDVVQIYFSN